MTDIVVMFTNINHIQMGLGQHVDLTVVGLYVDIYIYKGAFSSQDPRNLWLCLVCLVNNFDLPL